MEGTVPIPEQGQLVKVRGRAWIVSDVRRSALLPDPLRPVQPTHHLMTLTSVEDDGMGEEAQVLWEIEPGATILEKGGLPDLTGFDDPQRLDAFLHAVRWGASSTADYRTLLSPYRSGIQIEDYQLDPLVRAIQMPRANILIADDVGLGKTIEAGLIVQEFLTRHRARTVLIVCPSSLQIQWHDQMRDKFGLEFRIVDSALFQELRRRRGIHVNPWTHFPRLIASIDFLKRERPLDLMRAVLPPDGRPTYPRKFDILIVDEAHHVAPSGRGNYALDSQRTQTIRTIAPHFEHKIFVTATPHNGYQESFTALLEVLDNQRFARGVQPDERQLMAVMVRRLKTDLDAGWDGRSRFPRRSLEPILVPYTDEERDVHQALQQYSQLRRERAVSAEEKFSSEFVMKLLKKRLFSSPAAFYQTLTKHINTISESAPSTGRLQKPTLSILKQQAQSVEEDFSDDDAESEATQEAVSIASRAFAPLSKDEMNLLNPMMTWATQHRARPDTKAEELLQWLKREIRPDKWLDKRVVIFTEYRDTQNWLLEILASEGYTQRGRLLTLYGGMDPEKREEIKAAFQASPQDSDVRILLATDAASEGIDLQLHCNRLIHYEIPWNPNRMEQRNGRVDRYGQKADPVLIYHFVDQHFQKDAPAWSSNPGDLAGDLEFLYRAVIKLQEMERDLFGKVAPVVAQQVEQAMLGVRKALDTKEAEAQGSPLRWMRKYQEDIRRRIERLHEKLKETRAELELSPENVRDVVRVALELAGQPPLIETTLKGVWPELKEHYSSCPVFRIPNLRGSWGRCLYGLPHPHTHDIRPITFDHAIARDRDDVVLVHLNHQLVQMSLRLLRAEVWSETATRKLHRFSIRVVPDQLLENPALVGYARIVLVGKDGQRLHEEIITAGGVLASGRFKRWNVGELQKMLSSSQPASASASLREKLQATWSQHRDALFQALTARMEDRLDGTRRTLEERANKEMEDTRAVLAELERAIREEVEKEAPSQLPLFTSEEKDQVERNRSALEKRLREIPEEMDKELRAIAERFSNPKPHLFPAAVLFLVPHSLAVREAGR